MRYRAEVKVTLKQGVLDPQGQAVEGGLRAMGYGDVRQVRVGKFIEVWVEADSPDAARAAVADMAGRLLANPVLEEFCVQVAEEVPA